MKKTQLIFFVFISLQLSAQTVATFESFGLTPGQSLVDASPNAGFSDGNIFLPNEFSTGFWSGWTISAKTDVTTPGFMNDLSAITGGGVDGSTSYAVTYVFGNGSIDLTGPAIDGQVSGMYVTNNTFAYLSMQEGDSFAKKFGGESGDDPDFFVLTIKGYVDGGLTSDSVNFYLADYRFEDNAQDYIVNEWTWVDLTSLGNVDGLSFELNSSDVGSSGMNTPAYFCIDNVATTDTPSSIRNLIPNSAYSVYPNPFVETLNIQWDWDMPAELFVWSPTGQLVFESSLFSGTNSFEIDNLLTGHYVAEIQSSGKVIGEIILKK